MHLISVRLGHRVDTDWQKYNYTIKTLNKRKYCNQSQKNASTHTFVNSYKYTHEKKIQGRVLVSDVNYW